MAETCLYLCSTRSWERRVVMDIDRSPNPQEILDNACCWNGRPHNDTSWDLELGTDHHDTWNMSINWRSDVPLSIFTSTVWVCERNINARHSSPIMTLWCFVHWMLRHTSAANSLTYTASTTLNYVLLHLLLCVTKNPQALDKVLHHQLICCYLYPLFIDLLPFIQFSLSPLQLICNAKLHRT